MPAVFLDLTRTMIGNDVDGTGPVSVSREVFGTTKAGETVTRITLDAGNIKAKVGENVGKPNRPAHPPATLYIPILLRQRPFCSPRRRQQRAKGGRILETAR